MPHYYPAISSWSYISSPYFLRFGEEGERFQDCHKQHHSQQMRPTQTLGTDSVELQWPEESEFQPQEDCLPPYRSHWPHYDTNLRVTEY